jgi:hypothetical protein
MKKTLILGLVIAFIIAIPLCAYALSGRISLENKSKMS